MKKILLLLVLPIIIASCAKIGDPGAEEKAKTSSDSKIEIEKSFVDLGTIAMDNGNVSANFLLKNNGTEDIVIKSMETSCSCTKAKLSVADNTSREVGMHGQNNIFMIIKPGQEATVEAIYDPNFHGPSGTGLIRRSIFLETNSSSDPKIKLDFQVNVVKDSKDLPAQETFDFQEKEFDFGMLKQSGGIVKNDFTFTYNGNQDIKIIGVPTSCGCTSASIDKNSLSKGDKATITVSFDPNLHEEPEGKFFKTISLVTDPKVDDIEDLKIWAEIDLDLGPQAYKLQDDHDEDEEEHEEPAYNSITPAVFDEMLDDKDFVLIDVHIPEQNHIQKTDLFIPYNSIEENINKLPENKNDKIVVYCRSGSMSRAAAYTLAEMGYTNVYDLSGGKNAYDGL